MPFHDVICLVMILVFSSCILSFSDYAFEVNRVKKCPLDMEAWSMSSVRLNCNKSHGYHCVPNRNLTSLVEFCYPRGSYILFEKGNCLELAGSGILNHIPCNNSFSSGCPDSFYLSKEIYKYPKCLEINTTLGCFDSDTQCIKSRLEEYNAAGQIGKREKNISDERSNELTMNSSENITEQNIYTELSNTFEQSGDLTQNISEISVVLTENKTTERNKTVKQLGNSTLNNSEDSKILIEKHFELNNTTKSTDNLTKTNFEDYSVLVIILSSLLSIAVFVLVVGIVKKILKAYPVKRNTFRRNNKDESRMATEEYTPSIPSSPRHSYRVCQQDPETYYEEYSGSNVMYDGCSDQSSPPNALIRSADEESDDEMYEREVVPSSGPKKGSLHESCQPNALTRLSDRDINQEIYSFEDEVPSKSRLLNERPPQPLPRECLKEKQPRKMQLLPSKSRLIDERPPQPLPRECLKEKQPRKMQPLPDDEETYDEFCEGLLNVANRQVGSRIYSEYSQQDGHMEFYSSLTFQGMSALKQSTNHRQHRPLPSITTTSEVKPVSIQKRRLRGHLGKPPIPQPRTIIKQQSREPPIPSHPRNYSHQQVQPANETATSEAENLSDHIAVSSAGETSTTLSKKCVDFVVGLLTIMGADLKSQQLKLSDGNSLLENSPLLQNASSDQLKNSKSGSNMPDDVNKDYSERNDDVMNFQNESRKGRLCHGESRIKEKDWDANQEKTLQTNVYTHPQNSSELESKQTRLPVKRPYDSREGKEEFWMKSKRPVVKKTRFASNSTSFSDRLFAGSRGRNRTVDSRDIEGTIDDRRDMDNFSRDNRPKRRPTIRFERENDRSGTWYHWKDSCHHVQSDRRKKRYRDRRKTRTLPMYNGHEWKSKRENAVMETSFSRDNWQGGSNSPNEENVSLMEITYNPGQGPLGSPPDSQRNLDSIAERRKKDSSWSASKYKENRILGFEPQDRLTWNNLALQPNTWQQGFGTQMTSGHLETRVPVMFLAPQHT